jgi:2-hydroxychromene-2-carboxylate isomerase
MADKPIDFWFTMGSTYTYLSVLRLPDMARASSVSFRWRPFHLMVLLREMKHVPFADKPAKSAYMWRDIERRAAMYGIPAQLPAPYPIAHSERANLVAIVGMREGWGVDYVRAAYRRWFQAGEPNGSEANLSASLHEVGQEPTRVLALAGETAAGDMLAAETETARSLGLFGSPHFVVGRELFWGDDRLEDALDWHRAGRLASR